MKNLKFILKIFIIIMLPVIIFAAGGFGYLVIVLFPLYFLGFGQVFLFGLFELFINWIIYTFINSWPISPIISSLLGGEYGYIEDIKLIRGECWE